MSEKVKENAGRLFQGLGHCRRSNGKDFRLVVEEFEDMVTKLTASKETSRRKQLRRGYDEGERLSSSVLVGQDPCSQEKNEGDDGKKESFFISNEAHVRGQKFL